MNANLAKSPAARAYQRSLFTALVAVGATMLPSLSRAETAPVEASAAATSSPPPGAAAGAASPSSTPEERDEAERRQRARFSVGRFFVESLVGGAVGSLTAYGAYKGICGSEPCIGGAFAGLGANFGLTPLAVFGLGRAMGGHGGVGATYLGGLLPFGAMSAVTASSPALSLAIASALMPFTSALTFEFSSNMWAKEPLLAPKSGALPSPVLLNVAISPLADKRGSLAGGILTVSGQF